MLTDGHTTFTPGISEYNGLGSRFYLGDAQGNSRGLLDGGQSATDGYNWDAFGNLASRFGSNPTAYAWNGAAGYQSDGDSGLNLLGHRYYDSRTGRFISQDPAGDGDNWYAYCDNDSMDGVDPEGLWCPSPASYGNPVAQFADNAIAHAMTSLGSGYWDNGVPTGQVGGQFTNEKGERATQWVPTDGWGAFGSGLAVAGSAIASVGINGDLYNGGGFRHDSSFGVSRGLTEVAVTAASFGLGTLGTVERSGRTLVTHWDTAEGLANIAKNGLKEGSWLMKGNPNIFKWILTGKFLSYPYGSRITGWLPDNTVTQQQVDVIQQILGHYRYWPGVF